MLGEAEASLEQLERLVALSRALAKGGLIVYGCRFDYLALGSWTVEAGTEHRRLQIINDRREGGLQFHRRSYEPVESASMGG